jgi:glycosyltransferase involved in cell wall biosynthesis
VLISVIVPTHNPHPERFRRTLDGLRAQRLARDQWELAVVDNASNPPLAASSPELLASTGVRLIKENTLGLTAARRRGILETRGEVLVFVDDDNVLAPDYLENVAEVFRAHPQLGMAGGKCVPEFETPPAAWQHEFFSLLALRDLGPQPIIADPISTKGNKLEYPISAPIGAGMALRRTAASVWLGQSDTTPLVDRRGAELSSGGDNDIVLTLFKEGWRAGYFPTLQLTHLIPAGRLAPDYLARLNRGVQASWMRVLSRHDANPWPPIARWTVPLRALKAWFTYRAWSTAAARIRWAGACGHFEGRAV